MRCRSTLPAAFAVVLLLVGQLLALAHQADARHVTCDEHGHQIEAVELSERLHDCDQDHLIGVDSDDREHEDCAFARALHSAPPSTWSSLTVAAVETHATTQAPRPALVVRSLYRIAPKTSPPVPS